MGAPTADVNRVMFNEAKRFISLVAQQGPGIKPIVVDDINDGEDITFTQMRRLEQAALGDGFTGTSFKVVDNGLNNDFDITGGDGTDDGSGRGFLAGIPVSKYVTSAFNSTTNTEVYSKSTNLTATVLTDSAANYTTNELIGRSLYPNNAINLGYLITANTATTITTAGNMLAGASIGNRYRVALSTPSASGTRTDTVLLDVYVDEIDSTEDPQLKHNLSKNSGTVTIESAVRKKVEQNIWVKQDYASVPTSPYTDSDGNVHYVTRLATFLRSSGVATISNITDVRNENYASLDRGFQNVIIEESLTASGTINFSGTVTFNNNCANRPLFLAGVDIKGCDFNYTAAGKEFDVDCESAEMTLSSGLTVIAGSGLSLYSTTSMIPLGATKSVQFYSSGTAAYEAYFDEYARFHSDGLVDIQQLMIHPSGSSDKALVIYDYPSGSLERFTIKENGAVNIVPETNISAPVLNITAPATNTSHSILKIAGATTNATSIAQFETTVSSPVPNLVLKRHVGEPGNWFECYTSDQTIGSDTPYMYYDYLSRLQMSSPASIFAQIMMATPEGNPTIDLSARGYLEITPRDNNDPLTLNTNHGNTILASNSGTLEFQDNGNNIPGVVVKNASGDERVRLNANGLVLNSAEITQDKTTPTVLNILSNNGIVLDYDENDDTNGEMTFSAGSTAVASFHAKNALSSVFYRNLIVGSSGTVGASKLTIQSVLGNTCQLVFDNFQTESVWLEKEDDYLKIMNNAGTNRTSFKAGYTDIFIGDELNGSPLHSTLTINTERVALWEDYSCGTTTLSGTSIEVQAYGITAASVIMITPREAPAGRLWASGTDLTDKTFFINSSTAENNIDIDWVMFTKTS